MNVFILGVAHKGGSSLLASPYMEKELRLLGITPTVMAVSDETQLTMAIQRIVLLGGLILTPLTGKPNIDRLLSDSMAKACGLPLELEEQVFEQMAQRNVKLTREEAAQFATLPKGAQVYALHDNGYPAYQVDGENIHAIVLPADPAEQSAVFLNTVFPTFAQQPKYPCASHVIRVMDLSLSEVESALTDILSTENPCTAVYPGKDEVVVRVSVRAQGQQEAISACQSAAKTVLERLGSYVYGMDVPNIERALLQRLEKQKLHLALAESGSSRRGELRLIKCKKADSVELHFPKENSAAAEEAAKQYGSVSPQAAVAMAASIAAADCIGVAITMPTAREKAAHAYVAASFAGHSLQQEISLSGFKTVQQLANACVSHALNLARKFADAHPSLPKGAAAAFGAEAALSGVQEAAEEAVSEKKSLPKRILGAIFPTKEDPTKEKFRKLGLILCICVFCGSVGYLLDHRQQGINALETNKELGTMKEDFQAGKLDNYEIDQEKLEAVALEVLDEYKPFVAMNEDMRGWIEIEGTNLGYPVVQADDNDFYLRRNFKGEDDYYGIPFLDHECTIATETEATSDNLIIYGHNIGNDGLMFNPLSYYKQLAYYKEHPIIRFDSIYKQQEYKIIGVMIVNAQPEQDKGNVFRYWTEVNFDSDEAFNAYVDEVRRRSLWDIDVDTQPGDKLLTLSTCCYDFRPEARCVVVARAIREGEDRAVNTDNAKRNNDVYLPQAYYDAVNERTKYGFVKSLRIEGKNNYVVDMGETIQLKAIVSPSDAPINTCKWETSNAAVATVTQNGLVTAIAPGEATITAAADDGGYADNVKVVVRSEGDLGGIYFPSNNYTVALGQTLKLDVTIEGEAEEIDLKWSVSSTDVEAYGDENEPQRIYVTGMQVTETPVKVTVTDAISGLSASCYVSVMNTGVEVSVPKEMSLPAKTEAYLNLQVTPAEAAGLAASALQYKLSENITISDPAYKDGIVTYIVSIDDEVGAEGRIRFYLYDEMIGSCTITVVRGSAGENTEDPIDPDEPLAPPSGEDTEDFNIISPSGDVLDGGSYTLDTSIKKVQLDIEGAYADDCEWSSSNKSVATVSSVGVMRIRGVGTTTITVIGPDDEIAQFTLTIEYAEGDEPAEETPSEEETPPEEETPSDEGSEGPSRDEDEDEELPPEYEIVYEDEEDE